MSNAAENSPPVCIQNWGKGSRALLMKTPTLIAYAEENENQKEPVLIGTNVKPGTVSHTWFKLLLDKETNRAGYDDPLLERTIGSQVMTLPGGKSAKDVVSDYLRSIRKHIFNNLGGVLGGGLDITPLVFCVTVPANWSREAREATLTAAKAAGFGSRQGDDLICCDEPVRGRHNVPISFANKYPAMRDHRRLAFDNRQVSAGADLFQKRPMCAHDGSRRKWTGVTNERG